MSKIKKIKAREILDSRGNPTVEVKVETEDGVFKASVPSGASRGKREAKELRDGGKRYLGKGVLKAVKNINEIVFPKLKGKNVKNQKEIDEILIFLAGKNKALLGVNAVCPVSMAICRAGAFSEKLPLFRYLFQIADQKNPLFLPQPSFNIINGGLHAGNDLDFQEFMIVPFQRSFSQNLKLGSEVYHILKDILREKYRKSATNLGDEGGFAPPLKFPEEALELILKSAEKLDYKLKIIIDVAATQFFKEKKYSTEMGDLKREELSDYYLKLIKKYPLLGLEDPFAEDDFKAWRIFYQRLEKENSEILIIGDDLLVTNPQKIKKAALQKLANAVIIKINQIGTVSEAIEAIKSARVYGWKTIVSHRSGETNDDFISDFAVGVGADFIKSGAPARGERVAKYNRLLEIEEEILAKN